MEDQVEVRERVEYERHQALDRAVQAADRMIVDAADGDTDVLLLLTAQLARRFAEKVEIMASSAVMRRDLLERVKDMN
jgi:hypothetical protein